MLDNSHSGKGLIQNEEPEVVKIVEELVKENITQNCLMLVTIPMSGMQLFSFTGPL